MATLLAKNAQLLVTMDEQRREIPDAGLFVRDGIIEAVGPSTELHLDLHTINYAGALNDPVAAVLFCAPQKTRYTVINGRVIVEDGHLTTVDMGTVVEAHNRFAAAHAR